MLLVRKVEGPEIVEAGVVVTYRATEFNRANPSEREKSKINWMVECEGKEFHRQLRAGASLNLEIGDDLTGKTLVAMPYANSPSRAVSVVTLVRPRPERILRDGLAGIRADFADILVDASDALDEAQLAERVKGLKFAVDDLLDSAGPLGQDVADGSEDETPVQVEPKRLAIVVGHSERASGARALAPVDQSEYPFNKDVARRMEQAAGARGIAARTFLRDNVGIRGAYQAAAAFQPDAIIELHFNAAGEQARGSETLCCELNSKSPQLAQAVQRAMVQVFNRTGSRDRGVKILAPGARGYGNVSAAPGFPTVLVEPFFGSNEQECRLAQESVGAYAESLVAAFEAFVAGS